MLLDQDLITEAMDLERRLIDGQAEPKTLAHDCLVMIQRLRKALDSRDDYLQSVDLLGHYMEQQKKCPCR